ncbi:ABC transporter ATP-binding protein [Psychromarinibacter sp. C21-152]|uniref:ABC transporter ATP-binding protein n=1 Tax=Psychromarinibacter sediminicola TaxID=3033385 RepID=A0AAE3NMS0_9RHOB|nr:ABC transporter ATP-binding protein [Psychromarinibacter sediminicola]MDF0599134.1 ABC transporter ATP-binding protein [Psychromarinibacter sediminicola]
MTDVLTVNGLSVFYGARAQAVEDVSFSVGQGRVVALLGANGAGKSSIMKAVAGLIPAVGTVTLRGADISGMPARKRVARGVVYVPEGRQIVGHMTVRENLVLGGYQLTGPRRKSRMEMVLDLFPEIAEKADRSAWRLSGGEQQMLAIGRGLMAEPRLLLLDEPSLGLAPLLVRRVFDRLGAIRQESDLSIVLVEQNLAMTIRLCDEVHFLRSGRIVGHQDAESLRDPAARQAAIDAYLGASATAA